MLYVQITHQLMQKIKICKYYDVIDQLIISKSDLGSGIFYVTIYTSNKKTTRKLIIK